MITSNQNAHIKELAKLGQKKYRDETGLFLVEGYHLVEEASKKNLLKEVLSTKETAYEPTTLVEYHIIEKLSQTKNPQEIIGVCQKIQTEQSDENVLVLEVNDPGNLGTLLRSAVGFGFQKVYLLKGSVDPYNDKVLRATQGAIFQVELIDAQLDELATILKHHTWIAADMHGEILTERPKGKIALFLGHESHGVSDFVKEHAKLIRIPTETIESLNVAVAGSIMMYQLSKK